jgi:hypothetical protein
MNGKGIWEKGGKKTKRGTKGNKQGMKIRNKLLSVKFQLTFSTGV